MQILVVGAHAWDPGFGMTERPSFATRDHLIMAVDGRARYWIGDEHVDILPGELLFIRRGLPPHRWRVMGDEPWSARWLVLQLGARERARLAYPPETNGMVHLPAGAERNARMATPMTRMLELRGREGGDADELRRALVTTMLREITLHHGHPHDRLQEPVARALAFLDRHLSDPEVALADVVAAAGCARSVLVQRFTEAVGAPPMRHLEHRRLDVAAERLRHDHDPVGVIAEAVGYGDARYFATRFRRRFGCTPSVYRQPQD